MGDFNALLDYVDRFQGRPISTYEIQDFASCLQSSDLLELRSCGHYYSWTNKSQGDNRIDRCIINSIWMSKYTRVVVDYLNPGLSYHNPLLVKCTTSKILGGEAFQVL